MVEQRRAEVQVVSSFRSQLQETFVGNMGSSMGECRRVIIIRESVATATRSEVVEGSSRDGETSKVVVYIRNTEFGQSRAKNAASVHAPSPAWSDSRDAERATDKNHRDGFLLEWCLGKRTGERDVSCSKYERASEPASGLRAPCQREPARPG